MDNPLKNIYSIFELGRTLDHLINSGKIELKTIIEPNRIVRESDGQRYNCIETTKDYLDKEENLLCRITNFRGYSKNHSGFYIMIYIDEHRYRHLCNESVQKLSICKSIFYNSKSILLDSTCFL